MHARNEFIHALCEKIYAKYKKNNNRVPHGFFKQMVEGNKKDFPTLNKQMLQMLFQRYKKRKELPITTIVSNGGSSNDPQLKTMYANGDSSTASSLTNASEIANEARKLGGRPKGTTLISQRNTSLSVIAAKNEITEQ